MVVQPSEEDISNFLAITGNYERSVAIQFLLGAGNDVGEAINHFFDNPNKYNQPSQSYDESAFSQGRFGESSGNDNVPSFQIHAADETAGFTQSTAPTRPPSRASINVNISPQESGIIGGSGSYFGPATRESYDLQNWALTIPDTTAAEIIPDVDSWDRARDGQGPVFMKPLTSADPLPALVTILGRIPMAQEVMIGAGGFLDDYGSDPTWWSGTPIAVPETVTEGSQPSVDEDENLIVETQRLMAFMLDSTRAYGSVEPLESLPALKEIGTSSADLQPKNGVDKFVLAWTKAVETRHEEAAKLFRTLAASGGQVDLTFYQFEVCLEHNESPITLYDAVDSVIWDTDVTTASIEEENCLVDTAPILVMRIISADASTAGLKCSIPETWYLDRYMAENKGVVNHMRQNIAACKVELHMLDERKKHLELFKNPNSGSSDSSALLFESTIDYLRNTPADLLDDESDTEMEPAPADSTAIELADRLQSMYETLQGKVNGLNKEIEATTARLEHFSSLFKYPSRENPGQDALKHRYTLRGVSTNARTMYVCCPTEFDYLHWHKIEYDMSPSIHRETLLVEDVLKAASEDSREVLLVYASDEACRERDITLPQPLKDFVERDNLSFAIEQQQHEAQFQPAAYNGREPIDEDELDDPPPYGPDEDFQTSDPLEFAVDHKSADEHKSFTDGWASPAGRNQWHVDHKEHPTEDVNHHDKQW